VPPQVGRYNVIRDNPPLNGGRGERPDRLRGQRAVRVLIDDVALFNGEFPLRVGASVGIDPATGWVVPNSENQIGRIILDNLSLVSTPQLGIVAGVDVAAGSDRSSLTVARREFPEGANRSFRQEFIGEFAETPYPVRTELTVLSADPPRSPIGFTVEERIGVAAFNPRALERFQARRVDLPMFELQSNPQINLDEVRTRRFDLFDRSVRSIQEQMDQEILDALEGTFTNQRAPMISRSVEAPVPEPVKENFIRRTRFERIIDDTTELYPL
jgi:hypothetical protein